MSQASPQQQHSPQPPAQPNGDAPPSPSMSQTQQQNGPARQPVSYPSPTSYPSPSLSSAQYQYPAPSNQPVNEPYRASPTGSNGSMPLPSMRSLDPLQQSTSPHMTSPMPPAMGQMPYYQGQPMAAHQYPNVASDPTGQAMRYALPADANRVMSGGRHKKEIKRRTKTGCLTCRKRRIKCDEQHPVCRNCQKSKRECLGYDPIFKQQPGPAAIQPAPSAAPSAPATTAPVTTIMPPANLMQASYPPQPALGYDAQLSAAVSSPATTTSQFDYASAIDPALESAAPPPPEPNANLFQQPDSVKPLKMERVQTTIDELLDLGGAAPPAVPSSASSAQSPGMLDEVKHLYHTIYSPGLENFLESKWFPVKGIGRLMSDNQVLEQFLGLLDQFAKSARNVDPKVIQYTASVEARCVWALACMVRAASATNGVDDDKAEEKDDAVPATDDAVEAAHRLAVFEHLLCGQVLVANPLTKPVPTIDPHRLREFEFWYNLGQFVVLDDDHSSAAAEVDATLGTLRTLLDGRENRDVLYSIAVVRTLGPRISEYSESDPMPLHLDEHDPRSKLVVAKRFIEDEGNGGGTTNVIRRFCDLAARSWVVAITAAADVDAAEGESSDSK